MAVKTCGIGFKPGVEVLTVGDSFDLFPRRDVNGGAGKGVHLVGFVDMVDDISFPGSVIFGGAPEEKGVAESDTVFVFIFTGDSDETVGQIFG